MRRGRRLAFQALVSSLHGIIWRAYPDAAPKVRGRQWLSRPQTRIGPSGWTPTPDTVLLAQAMPHPCPRARSRPGVLFPGDVGMIANSDDHEGHCRRGD